jgi:hypothetical protein
VPHVHARSPRRVGPRAWACHVVSCRVETSGAVRTDVMCCGAGASFCCWLLLERNNGALTVTITRP